MKNYNKNNSHSILENHYNYKIYYCWAKNISRDRKIAIDIFVKRNADVYH